MKLFKSQPNIFFALAASAVLVCLSLTGCTNDTVADSESLQGSAQPEVASQANPKTPKTSVAQPTSTVEASPSRNQLPDAKTGPVDICREFLRHLRKGNRITAEQLLTRKALTVTSQAQLELEAMGSDQAKYKFSDARFATHKNKLAYVDCKISDIIEGKSVETEMTWLVKTQKEGWRISGILVEVVPDQPKNLLSFENFEDVNRIKGSLAVEVQETHTIEHQASAEPGLFNNDEVFK